MAAPEFLDDDLPHELMAIVDAAGVDPSLICLELTEGVIMRASKRPCPSCELVRLGFEISLDDFGMGYSSLSLLKTLPISSIKIDRVFLQGVPHSAAIARSSAPSSTSASTCSCGSLPRAWKARPVDFLRQFDCTQVQGYLSGRPMELGGMRATARCRQT
jgi:EAL domain-containing protein (putative c-di-GMP-specific phosphodiesterase class I)